MGMVYAGFHVLILCRSLLNDKLFMVCIGLNVLFKLGVGVEIAITGLIL